MLSLDELFYRTFDRTRESLIIGGMTEREANEVARSCATRQVQIRKELRRDALVKLGSQDA